MKPNATKRKAKAVTAVEEQRRKNVRDHLIGRPLPHGAGTDGLFDRQTIAKAMEFSPANVTHWMMDPQLDGHRAISENAARTLEEKLRLPAGSLDLPDMGGFKPGSTKTSVYQQAETILKRAERRTGKRLDTKVASRVVVFLYNELSEGREVTDDAADSLVRLSAS